MRFNLLRRALPLALVPLAAGLMSCSDQPQTSGLLAHVPADTPYVFVASEPLPEPLYDHLMAMNALQMQDVEHDLWMLSERMAELGQKQQGKQGGKAEPLPAETQTLIRVMEALIGELQGRMDAQGMQALGFDYGADSVIYGLSLFPVMRAEVSDPVKVEALLARIEQRAEAAAPRGDFQGQSYRRIPFGDQLVLVIAVHERQLLMAMLPVQAEQALLAQLLGTERPERPLADTATLAELRQQYDYQGFGEGYLDIRAVSEILLGIRRDGLDQHWQALTRDMPRPSPGCETLLTGLAAKVPRVVAGITDVQADSYAMTAAYETAPELGAQLARLARPRPLPGMGSEGDALFSMGLDVDVAALREALKGSLRYLAEQGRDCEWIEPAQIQAALPNIDLMLGPMSGGLSGMYLALDDLQVDADAPQGAMGSGGLLLAISDPQAMVAMAGMMNPALAQIQLSLDGEAVAVPRELLPPGVPLMHLAASQGLLAIAVGEDSAQRASALLRAPTGDTPMLLGVSYDNARFMSLMAQLMGVMADRLELAGEAEQAQQLRAQASGFAASAGQGGRMQLSVAPDARGLMLRQQVRLE